MIAQHAPGPAKISKGLKLKNLMLGFFSDPNLRSASVISSIVNTKRVSGPEFFVTTLTGE